MDRKLAAILAADVVGYSSLMEADEAGTFARLKAHRAEVFEPEVKLHHGRIFKMMGDGLLAEFGSVVDAVECAVAVQKEMARRNAGAASDQRIDLRIGVNLGDVIVEGKDRHGEGVNIAARLEQLAPPGGICVSQTVIDHLSNKLPIGFEAMGEHQVKNIAKPVAVYRAKLDGAPVKRLAPVSPKRALPWAAAVTALLLTAGGTWYATRVPSPEAVTVSSPAVADGKPSLVVLPFANLSDDKEQGYLADGITEDLTTELARVPGLFVVSRNAAFTYKGKAVAPADIARQLGVRYILEGSTRRVADEMRINAQLIDAETGGHLWAERFDGKWAEVFTLQDKVVENVAGALKLRLVTGQSVMTTPGGTQDPAAYEAYLRAVEFQNSDSPENWAKAIRHYEEALTLDPAFGRAAAELSMMYRGAVWVKSKLKAIGISQDEARARKSAYFDKAATNPSAAYYQLLAGELVGQQKWEEAIVAAGRSIALDPSDPLGHEEMSWDLTLGGRPAEGKEYVEAALRIDPRWNAWRYVEAALAEFSLDRFAEAAALLEKLDSAQEVSSYWDFWARYTGLQLLVATYGHLGRSADATAVAEKLKPYLAEAYDDELVGLLTIIVIPFKNHSDTERLIAGLRKAGVPELPYGHDPDSKDRLSGEEIRSLVLGHTLAYRNIGREPGMTASTTFTRDGRATLSRPDATVNGTFLTTAQEGDDTICISWDRFGIECAAVLRNPNGKSTDENEFFWINSSNPWTFSVVK